MKKYLRILFAVLVSSWWFTSSTYADQMIYQPGPAQGADVWLSSQYDYGSNFGVDDDKLQAGGWGDEYRFLLKFDLTGLPLAANNVAMWMVPFAKGDASTPVDLYIDRVTTGWDENAGWYDGQPASTPLWWVGAPTPGYWYGLNITNVYNNWQNGTYPNYGFKFRPTGINNQFSQFLSSDYWYAGYRPQLVITYSRANLAFPLKGTIPTGQPNAGSQYGPYTPPISAVIDHQVSTGFNCPDNVVVAYTGETGKAEYGISQGTVPPSDSCPGTLLYGFKNSSRTAFSINGQYRASSSSDSNTLLFYDGHSGMDYPVPYGTPVYAADAGTATCDSSSGVGLGIKITHASGYDTYYLHLSSRSVVVDCQTSWSKCRKRHTHWLHGKC